MDMKEIALGVSRIASDQACADHCPQEMAALVVETLVAMIALSLSVEQPAGPTLDVKLRGRRQGLKGQGG
jgi:hypothetical protein